MQVDVQYQTRPSLMPVTLSALVLAGVFAATHLLPIPGGKKAVTAAIDNGRLFDQSPSFDAAEVLVRLEGFGEQGRAAYQTMMYTSDLIFPLAILALLLLTSRYLFLIDGQARLPRVAALLAVSFFGTDMIENSIIYYLLATFPEASSLGSLLGIVTSAKFAFLASAVLVLLVSAASWVVMRR
jgi:hypothetical protein